MRDQDTLQDIRNAATRICTFVQGVSETTFRATEEKQYPACIQAGPRRLLPSGLNGFFLNMALLKMLLAR